MPREHLDDESLADPSRLLVRYRQMCKTLGVAQATGNPVPRETLHEISRIEAELQTRLWLASRSEANSEQQSAISEKRVALSHQSSVTNPGPEHPTPNTHHPTQSSVLSPQSSTTAEVYSDGSCLGNPGPGGYGTIVRVPGHPERSLSGSKARTTNNDMEMTGAAEGLKAAIAMGANGITVISDSEYLVKGMNSWMKGWIRNGWKTRTGDPVKNRELWEELHRLTQGQAVTWTWVAGHAGHPENERCNTLAIAAAQQAALSQKKTR